MTSAARIVIDADDVRALATRMRGGAFIFSNSARTLAQEPLPSMPPSVAARVSEAIWDSAAVLQDLAAELIEEAAHLEARATWAELGGGAETAWLIPGLRRHPTLPHIPSSPVAEVPPVPEEQIRAAERWAVEILEGIEDSPRASDESDGMDTTLPLESETPGDAIPARPLGDFTLVGPDAARLELDAATGPSPASGALGAGLTTLFSSPTGWGIAGCLIAGGLIASPGGPREEG